MFEGAIDEKTKRVLEKIARTEITGKFYLAGGTALAIQIGHRKSIDLDWFCPEDFSNREIKDKLSGLGAFKLSKEEQGTIHGELDEVKITFLAYKYRQLYPFANFDGVNLADQRDIAAMKIDAASTRGSKKDFFDLFFLLKKYDMAEMVGFFEKKFSGIEYNKVHILKSLSYFEDAENDPDPIMLEKSAWEDVKREIAKKSTEFLDRIVLARLCQNRNSNPNQVRSIFPAAGV